MNFIINELNKIIMIIVVCLTTSECNMTCDKLNESLFYLFITLHDLNLLFIYQYNNYNDVHNDMWVQDDVW